jgi:hypothetical protein
MKIKDYFFNERESLLQQKSQQRIVATALKKKKKKGIQLPQLTVEEKTEFNYYIQRVI